VITSRIIPVALATVMAVGCGGGGGIKAPRTASVSGTVQFKGRPVAGVKVTFHPQFDMGAVKFTPSGESGTDGRFTLSTAAANDGAPPGDYVVTFEYLRGGADPSGRDIEVDVWKGKYADPTKSTWKVTIRSGENVLEPFVLN
jgi:hypothetical protein